MGIGCRRFGDRDPELALGEARRDLGVGLRRYVGVHSKGHAGDLAHGRCDGGKRIGLRGRFQIELEHILIEGEPHLRFGLADAGKDDLVGRHSRGSRTADLATGYDVAAEPDLGEGRQNRGIGIRLYGIGDQRIAQAFEARSQNVDMAQHGRRRIDVGRSSHLGGNLRQRHVLAVELAVPELKVIHLGSQRTALPRVQVANANQMLNISPSTSGRGLRGAAG